MRKSGTLNLTLIRVKFYSHYNLYTITGRPSNSYNTINFAALDKTDGERSCYRPENSMFLEFDFQGYHPRLAASLVGFPLPEDKNIYEYLNVDKIKMFENLYGGIRTENLHNPFFASINNYIDDIYNSYSYQGYYTTNLRRFGKEENLSSNKLFNYVLQAKETYENVKQLQSILEFLEDKKTKLVLYTYDAFLFDFNKEDGKDTLLTIQKLLHYPVTVKQGLSYNGLEKNLNIYGRIKYI
jgi:hypothetical protein